MQTPEQNGNQSERLPRPTESDILEKLELYKRAEEGGDGGSYMIEEVTEYSKD